VVADMSMSLDGFIAGPNDRIDEIFAWFSSGDVEVPVPNQHVIPAFRPMRRARRSSATR
jgi:hypothetical protein